MTLWSDPNHIAIRRQPVFIVTGQVVKRHSNETRSGVEPECCRETCTTDSLARGKL